MYIDKIQSLECEIQELNKFIKADKKEIKKREKIIRKCNEKLDRTFETLNK